MPLPRVIFITGTDTGVGKTVLTALLLKHLRATGVHALAMKPFCSGGTEDVDLLFAAQDGEIDTGTINPFFYPEPVAPLVAARSCGSTVTLSQVQERIVSLSSRCQCLLVEGAGGLMVPLGEGFTVADLLEKVADHVVVVAANRLGTINHTLLTVRALQALATARVRHRGELGITTVLMEHAARDESSATNEVILRELLDPIPLVSIVFLGDNPRTLQEVEKNRRKLKKTLAKVLPPV